MVNATRCPPLLLGYSHKNWVGVCGPLPKTLTLFIAKICDFPYPIYDLTKNMAVAAGTVTLNIVYEGLLLMVLSIMMIKWLLLTNILNARPTVKTILYL